MGAYPRGFNPGVVNPALIAEAMRPAVELWMKGRAVFFDPEAGQTTSAPLFDTDVDGCLLVPLRGATAIEFGGQSTYLQGVQIQIKRAVWADSIQPGVRIKITDGGNASELERYFFTVNEAVDGTLAWDRIITASLVTSVSV